MVSFSFWSVLQTQIRLSYSRVGYMVHTFSIVPYLLDCIPLSVFGVCESFMTMKFFWGFIDLENGIVSVKSEW